MKIKELFENLVMEAAAFRGKEKAEVLREIENFRFGLEFEFNVDDKWGAKNYDLDEELTLAEISAKIKAIAPQIKTIAKAFVTINKVMPDATMKEIYRTAKGVVEGNKDPVEAMRWMGYETDTVLTMVSAFQSIIHASASLVQSKSPVSGVVGIGMYRNASRVLTGALQRLPVSLPKSPSNPMVIEGVMADIYDVIIAWADHVSSKEVAYFGKGDDENTIYTKILKVLSVIMRKTELPKQSSGGINKVDWTRERIKSYVNPRYIHSVVHDVSVRDGVEVVTNPLSFRDILKCMDEMFAFISSIGSTGETTGLHVNISYKGESFQNMNIIKAMTLLDDHHVTKSDVAKWPTRMMSGETNHNVLTYKDSNGENMVSHLAKIYARFGGATFLSEYENIMKRHGRNEKYISFNIKSFLKGDVSEKRVEWRVMGGRDYHKRKDDIVNDMLHVCYVILAGMDENFLRQEYLKSVVRTLDRVAKESKQGGFVELVSKHR